MTNANSNASTSKPEPYSLNVVGIGRSGAGYVDGLLRTGEIEDVLMDPRARVAALVIDVGDSDLQRVDGYAAGLKQRLEEQGVPALRRYDGNGKLAGGPSNDDQESAESRN